METVSVRDLRNHGGDILDRVARGEHLTITRDGAAVAELSPLAAPGRALSALIDARRTLPAVDPRALRADVDAVVEQQW
ncbi:type II toxin-antitoxin system prevent-host-death family antitoxin [Leifsonia shinshuensis]|uniref:type II toxin-antitoxin system Phd/YefM family antitoxin n=1 Tax=Leifsonia TaxID=110932 RepID=UPI002857A301|nr:type II toxin-antitoxin system prevent-host-death family antitoxin [Leifsonia shinshuensis]MDR6970203.1 prevent-host-death family protein [Leifsonia shinshuensis]